MYDVLIAGAGTAGTALAGMLADSGRRVVLVDPGTEESLGFDWKGPIEKGVFRVAGIGGPEPDEVATPVTDLVVHSPDMRFWKTIHGYPAYLIHRRQLLLRLLNQARDKGVEVRLGTRVHSPLYDGIRVFGASLEDGDRVENVMARVTVDATGVRSALRRRLPEAWGVETGAFDGGDVVRIYHEVRRFDPKKSTQPPLGVMSLRYGRYGWYSWLYRETEDRIDCGAGVAPMDGAPEPSALVKRAISSWEGVCDEVHYRGGGVIPVRRPLDSFVWHGFAVLGDAAAQVMPLNGRNCGTALAAARVLADVLGEVLSDPPIEIDKLWRYNVTFQRGRGALLAAGDVLRRGFYSLSQKQINYLFKKDVLTAEFLSRLWHLQPVALLPHKAFAASVKGITRPFLVRRMNDVVKAARSAYRHYHGYPQVYDPDEFGAWSDEARRIVESPGRS